jgi:hypothetical protein
LLWHVDLTGHAAEGIDGTKTGSGRETGEAAAVRIAEVDRLIGPGQDPEDHDGGREQRAQSQQDPAEPRAATAREGRLCGTICRRDGLGDGHPLPPQSLPEAPTIHQNPGYISHNAPTGTASIRGPKGSGFVPA